MIENVTIFECSNLLNKVLKCFDFYFQLMSTTYFSTFSASKGKVLLDIYLSFVLFLFGRLQARDSKTLIYNI